MSLAPPSEPKFHFHAFFGGNWSKIGWRFLAGLVCLPLGNPGSATTLTLILYNIDTLRLKYSTFVHTKSYTLTHTKT